MHFCELPKHIVRHLLLYIPKQHDLFHTISKTDSLLCQCIFEPELWQMRRLTIDFSLIHLLHSSSMFSQVHHYLHGIELVGVSVEYQDLIRFLHETNCKRLWIDDERVDIVMNSQNDEFIDDGGSGDNDNDDNDGNRKRKEQSLEPMIRLNELRSIVCHFPIIPSQMIHLLSEKLGRILLVNFSFRELEMFIINNNRRELLGCDENNENQLPLTNGLDMIQLQHPFPAKNLIELVLFRAEMNDNDLYKIVSQQNASSRWRLKTLRLIDCSEITSKSLSVITEYCSTLQELQIEVMDMNMWFGYDDESDSDSDYSPQDDSLVLHPLNELLSVTLHCVSKSITEHFLNTVIQNPLKELDILHTETTLTDLNENTRARLMHLEKLTISDKVLSKLDISSLITPQLKSLKLFGMHINSQLLKQLEHIESLEYEECIFMSDSVFLQSCALPKVQEVFISSCSTDDSMEEPLLSIQYEVANINLEVLQISVEEYCSFCDRVLEITENAPNMKNLALDSPSSSGRETADLLLSLSCQELPEDLCLRYTLYIHETGLMLSKFRIKSIELFVAATYYTQLIDIEYFDIVLLIAICCQEVQEVKIRLSDQIQESVRKITNDMGLNLAIQSRLPIVAEQITAIDRKRIEESRKFSPSQIKNLERCLISMIK